MRSMENQIGNKCIHFNGVMNGTCKAGVKYADVRVDKPYKFPCLKQGGECSLCEFPTPEQVQKQIEEIKEVGTKSFTMYAAIKCYVEKTGIQAGKVECLCGGEMNYSVAQSNGHVWAKCKQCGISFNE